MSTVVPNNRHYGRASDPCCQELDFTPMPCVEFMLSLRIIDVASSCMVKIAQEETKTVHYVVR
jgi:hypothetical protein